MEKKFKLLTDMMAPHRIDEAKSELSSSLISMDNSKTKKNSI